MARWPKTFKNIQTQDGSLSVGFAWHGQDLHTIRFQVEQATGRRGNHSSSSNDENDVITSFERHPDLHNRLLVQLASGLVPASNRSTREARSRDTGGDTAIVAVSDLMSSGRWKAVSFHAVAWCPTCTSLRTACSTEQGKVVVDAVTPLTSHRIVLALGREELSDEDTRLASWKLDAASSVKDVAEKLTGALRETAETHALAGPLLSSGMVDGGNMLAIQSVVPAEGGSLVAVVVEGGGGQDCSGLTTATRLWDRTAPIRQRMASVARVEDLIESSRAAFFVSREVSIFSNVAELGIERLHSDHDEASTEDSDLEDLMAAAKHVRAIPTARSIALRVADQAAWVADRVSGAMAASSEGGEARLTVDPVKLASAFGTSDEGFVEELAWSVAGMVVPAVRVGPPSVIRSLIDFVVASRSHTAVARLVSEFEHALQLAHDVACVAGGEDPHGASNAAAVENENAVVRAFTDHIQELTEVLTGASTDSAVSPCLLNDAIESMAGLCKVTSDGRERCDRQFIRSLLNDQPPPNVTTTQHPVCLATALSRHPISDITPIAELLHEFIRSANAWLRAVAAGEKPRATRSGLFTRAPIGLRETTAFSYFGIAEAAHVLRAAALAFMSSDNQVGEHLPDNPSCLASRFLRNNKLKSGFATDGPFATDAAKLFGAIRKVVVPVLDGDVADAVQLRKDGQLAPLKGEGQILASGAVLDFVL